MRTRTTQAKFSGCGSIAQLGEHLPYKQRVTGSSPVVPTKIGPVVQLVRTLACHARGRRFEPVPGRQFCLCSSVGRAEDWKSSCRWFDSVRRHQYADVAHLVERHLAKVEVASSSLVIRSISTLWVHFLWRHSQVVRHESAKLRFPSSNLGVASNDLLTGLFNVLFTV